MGGVTFAVSEVALGQAQPALERDSSVRSLLGRRVEAMRCDAQRLVSCDTQHPLAKAAHDAFFEHLPLVIRPDDVWFCIAQGFATHVNQNAEALRERFVRHAGRERIIVSRPDFALGRENPWPELFEAFSEQIGERVGKLGELVRARFSTSSAVEIAAFDVALMDSFQGYFEYLARLGCGIPQITLLGTPDDWASMIPRVRHLSEYGLERWVGALLPVLDKLVETASGAIDQAFWRSFFRYDSSSLGSELTGWLLTLFPYVIVDWRTKALGPNPHLESWEARLRKLEDAGQSSWQILRGPSLRDIPSGLVSAPVRCVDESSGQADDLRFVAGMFGVEQHETTLALAPAFGWAVVYDD